MHTVPCGHNKQAIDLAAIEGGEAVNKTRVAESATPEGHSRGLQAIETFPTFRVCSRRLKRVSKQPNIVGTRLHLGVLHRTEEVP
jgi:hypothetical protein